MTRLKAVLLGMLLVPASAFLFFLGMYALVGGARPDSSVLGAPLLPFAFSLPITVPLGAALGLVLFVLAARNHGRARLLAFPVGFAAGIVCTYATSLLLTGGRSFGYPAQILTWPLWLYAALVSYGFAFLLTASGPSAPQHAPGNIGPVAGA